MLSQIPPPKFRIFNQPNWLKTTAYRTNTTHSDLNICENSQFTIWELVTPYVEQNIFSIIMFSMLSFSCSNLRNIQEQVKKAFCYQKLFWPFTVWINCSSDLKNFANSQPSAWNFKSFSRSLEQFFLTVSQNNFGNKIPFHHRPGTKVAGQPWN